MAKEIERKFLVTDSSYRDVASESHEITQFYLSTNPDRTVRVRIMDDHAFITVKTRNKGSVRNEWEFEINSVQAREILHETGSAENCISKIRYIVPAGEPGLCWEVDEFKGKHNGLVVAEIELPSPDTGFNLPSFIGEEVTGKKEYYNSSLVSSTED